MLFKGIWRTRDVLQGREYVRTSVSRVMAENHRFRLSPEDQCFRDLAVKVVAQTIYDYLHEKPSRTAEWSQDVFGRKYLVMTKGTAAFWPEIFQGLDGWLMMAGISLSGDELWQLINTRKDDPEYLRNLKHEINEIIGLTGGIALRRHKKGV